MIIGSHSGYTVADEYRFDTQRGAELYVLEQLRREAMDRAKGIIGHSVDERTINALLANRQAAEELQALLNKWLDYGKPARSGDD